MSAPIKKPDTSAMRHAIFRLEDYIKSVPGNGIEESGIQHIHHFAPGVYAREMIVPPDVLMTGAVHKTEHISIFLEGRMLIPDGQGGSKEIQGPVVEIGKPGIKRVGWTLDQVRWITIHPTEETDVELIEQQIVTNDPVEADCIARKFLIDGEADVEYDEQGFIEHILEKRS
jgi:hypothetical protein